MESRDDASPRPAAAGRRARTALTLACAALLLPLAAATTAGEEREPSAAIVGLVTDGDGRPISGARVLAVAEPTDGRGREPADPGDVSETLTAEDGRFAVAPVGPGRHAVLVDHPDHPPAYRLGLVPGAEARIRLEPAVALSGRVLDGATGRPLAGVRVEAHPAGVRRGPGGPLAEAARSAATTDDAGAFRIGRLEPGLHDVSAVAHGYARTVLEAVTVRIDGAASPAPLLYLREGVAVAGRVVDAAGEPVEGALVQAMPGRIGPELFRGGRTLGASLSSHAARTAEDGTFVVEGLPPATGVLVEVRHDDYAPAWREVETRGRAEPVTIRLSRGGAVAGRLMIDDDTPFEGEIEADVVLDLRGVRSFRPVYLSVQRDASEISVDGGAFRIERLPGGDARLTLLPAGRPPVRRSELRLADGEELDLGVILFDGGPTISGVVVGSDDEPVAGARVVASATLDGRRMRSSASSDRAGRFTIDGLPADASFRVTVAAEGMAPYAADDVAPDGEPLVAVLGRQGRVTGRALAGDPTAPVQGARVTAYAKETDDARAPPWLRRGGSSGTRALVRDKAGAFSLELLPGRYTIKVDADGYVPERVEDVEVRADEELPLGDVLLQRGVPVEGQVVDGATGNAVAGASVAIESPGRRRSRGSFGSREPETAAVTDPGGRFALAGLAPGVHALRVEAEGLAPRTVEVAVERGVPVDPLRIELSTGGWIEGTVRDATTGEPLVGAIVSARVGFGGGGGHATATDETGAYLLANLPPGTYRVSVVPTGGGGRGPGSRMERVQVESATVRAGRTTALDFPPPAGGLRVTGSVRRGGEPMEARLVFTAAGSEGFLGRGFASAASGPDGAFEVTLARPGAYDVRVLPTTTEDRRRDGVRSSYNLSADVGEDAAALELVVGENLIAGRVLDVDTGSPIEGVRVVAHRVDRSGTPLSPDRPDASTRSLEDGSYAVDGLPEGDVRLWFLKSGHLVEATEEMRIGEDDEVEDVDVSLAPLAPVEVTVTDASGVPVEGAFVVPLGVPTRALMFRTVGVSDVDGLATLEALPAGRQPLGVVARGHAPRIVELDPELPDDRRVTARLERGQPVRVVVLDAEEAPVEGAAITVAEDEGEDLTPLLRQVQRRRGASLVTGEDGTVVLGNVEPGRYVVTAARDGLVATDTVTIRAGEDDDLELTLR